MNYYHIDRENKLKPDLILELFQLETLFDTADPGENIRNIFSITFPKGVSWHGDSYFLADGAQIINRNYQSHQDIVSANNSQLIETIFELIRKAYFPDKPSRWQSLFALKTLKQAKRFREKRNWAETSPIWEIEADTFIRVDMNLLNASGRTVDVYERAFRYWSGQSGQEKSPCWEYLLEYPVKVVKQVS